METKTCKICGQTFNGQYALGKHRRASHPTMIRQYKARVTESPTSAFDCIIQAEQSIRKALLQLETERQQLSEKLLRLDDTIAKYKKLV